MTTATPHPAIPLPLVRDPDLLPPLEMDGYHTGVLVTPHLETAQWVMGLWRERSAVDTARIEQGLVTVLAHRKAIEASFAKGWPGFSPAFCEPGQKPDHGKVRTWVRGFWSAMKLAPDYWSAIAEDERTATFVALFTGFMDIGEPFDERDDANAIRDEHAALIPRALVGMRKLALMREDTAPTHYAEPRLRYSIKPLAICVPCRSLLGHTNIQNTVRCLGVDVNDAFKLSERT